MCGPLVMQSNVPVLLDTGKEKEGQGSFQPPTMTHDPGLLPKVSGWVLT